MPLKNHPPKPMLRITNSFSFKAALALVDVRVLDHLIVAGDDILSWPSAGCCDPGGSAPFLLRPWC